MWGHQVGLHLHDYGGVIISFIAFTCAHVQDQLWYRKLGLAYPVAFKFCFDRAVHVADACGRLLPQVWPPVRNMWSLMHESAVQVSYAV